MRVSPNGIVAPVAESELTIETVHLAPDESLEIGSTEDDALLFVLAGEGVVSTAGGHVLHAGVAALVLAGESAKLSAREDGVTAVRALVGSGVDRHAPLGPPEPLVAVEHVEAGSATGKRSFQVLYGPHNGSMRATLFVGYVPPGAAPWHFHLYDEIVWIWRGEGRFHTQVGAEPLVAGSAFRIAPREVHIVENTAPRDELVVLGLFTPAGSPSAAYLAVDEGVTYAIAGAR
jgi:quercetin dioxygenase-like cupin family protein